MGAQIPSEPNSQETPQPDTNKTTSCTVQSGDSNFSTKFTDNRPHSTQAPLQVQQLFTKALELPRRPKDDPVQYPETPKPEIDVKLIKNVMQNVSLPEKKNSCVSSLSSKMKGLSDAEFQQLMSKM